jgi:hypothetical protein
MKNCTIGKSCGSTCINGAMSCQKDLPKKFSDFSNWLQKRHEGIKKEIENFLEGKLEGDFIPTDPSGFGGEEAEKKRREWVLSKYEGVEIEGVPSELWKDVIMNGKELGSGSYGTVYAKGDLAVKVGKIEDPEIEGGKMAHSLGLGPKILGHKVTDSEGILVQERVRGISLAKVEEWADHMPKSFLTSVVNNLARAEAVAEEGGIMHGDYHGGNVVVGKDGSVKMIDWAFHQMASPDYVRDYHRSEATLNSLSWSFFGSTDLVSLPPEVSPEAISRIRYNDETFG